LLNNTKSINYIDVNKKHKIFLIQKKDHNQEQLMFSNIHIFLPLQIIIYQYSFIL